MSGSHRFRNGFVLAAVAVLAITVSVLIATPHVSSPSLPTEGNSVHFDAMLTGTSVVINECYLRKANTTSIDTTNNVAAGPNTATLTVYDCNAELDNIYADLDHVAKANTGAGNYVFDSHILPDLKINTPLLVHISIYNPDGSVLAQNATTILYK
jgi:hypothetical protein